MRLLIIEDDVLDREHLAQLLQQSDPDWAITQVSSVDEGLALYEAQTFDALLLDYRMPGRDGLDMLKAVRMVSLSSSVAVVIMSHVDDEALAYQCLKAGAQDFIPKADITAARVRRAVLHGKIRFELENELKSSYEKVKQLAERDALTGLANRHFFDASLKVFVANHARARTKLALFSMDLDKFKSVNENHGHDVGDVLLQRVVKRIQVCLRGNELFARLGGDEFAVVIHDLDVAMNARRVAQRIVSVLEKPFEFDNFFIQMSASIGIAIYPENGLNADELFKFADIAMYRAKKMGRNRVCFFEDDMQVQLTQLYMVEQQLSAALEKREFLLHYHPCLDPRTEQMVAVEALVRWQHQGELRFPDTFIPVSEDNREIIRIGRWIIEEALQQVSTWHKLGYKVSMAINVSAVQLYDRELPMFIERCLIQLALDPVYVEFELTETALLDNTSDSMAVLDKIYALGCHLALDDFGTGFSSIAHLRRFPIRTVKIDRSLMPNQEDDRTRALMSGLAAMVHSMGLSVVAEGVETQQHLNLCNELKIERVQGYFFTRPLAAQDFERIYCQRKRVS